MESRVESRFGKAKTLSTHVVLFLMRVFVSNRQRVVVIDRPIEPRNKAGKCLGSDKRLIHTLRSQAAVQIRRQDESVLRDIAPNKVEGERGFVLLNRAADIAVPE